MEKEDYCVFLKRSARIVEELLEDWEHVDKEDLKARLQLYQTAVTMQLAHYCQSEK